ncbi:LOW QUALITY PROTEIN: hypothetical protein RJ641_016152 [Dillenia turbinata]|uniref:Uncharacterized protein n=1 Tax=Dillenia turbinata TaxID=194707 RepID=A0AAN8V2J9_9MAGN
MLTPELSAVLRSDSADGASAGDPAGVAVGGAGGDSLGDGADASGAGVGALAGDGVGELTGSGAGAGVGDAPKSSTGRSTLSTVKITSGVSSITVLATLEESTPVFRVTSSPEVVTAKPYFSAPFVANVLISLPVVFNVANVFNTPLDSSSEANVLHPALFSNPVMLTSEADGAGAVKTPGAMIGELICKTEMLYGISFTLFCNVLFVAGDGGAETDFAASDVGNVHET